MLNPLTPRSIIRGLCSPHRNSKLVKFESIYPSAISPQFLLKEVSEKLEQ